MKLRGLEDIPIKKNRVLVRVDWNVPIKQPGKQGQIYDILSDQRIRASYPTFDLLLKKGAKRIYVMTHLGRPQGKKVENLRTYPLKHHFAKTYPDYSKEKFQVLENIRFDPREEKGDQQLAKMYAGICQVYVNDALSVCHRAHTSVVTIPQLIPAAAGPLLIQEVDNLIKIKDAAEPPLVVVIGGDKIKDKKPAILNLAQKADKVLVGGKTALEAIKDPQIVQNKKVFLATGGRKNQQGEVWDISEEEIEKFKQVLEGAKTVFWNGNLGKSDEPGFEKGSEEIARFLAGLSAWVVAAGGDTLALIEKLGLEEKFDYLCLGGGASLAFLADHKLPGLEVLKKS